MRRREEQLEPPIVLKNIYFQKLIFSPPWIILDSFSNFVLFRWLCRMWQNVAGYPRLGPYYPSTGYDSDSAILYSIHGSAGCGKMWSVFPSIQVRV